MVKISGADINALVNFDSKTPKMYYCENCANYPWTNGWLVCLPAYVGNNRSCKQLAFRHGSININNYQTQVRNYWESSSLWSDWFAYVTNADYIIRGTGAVTVTVPATKTVDTEVIFSVSYPETPHVFVFGSNASACYLSATAFSRSPAGFSIRAYNPTASSVTADLRWMTLY